MVWCWVAKDNGRAKVTHLNSLGTVHCAPLRWCLWPAAQPTCDVAADCYANSWHLKAGRVKMEHQHEVASAGMVQDLQWR